jgi:CHAT domain-containing protein
MASGAERGKGEAPIPVVPAEEHPFAHPRYWAAFILIGDPG